MRILVLAYCNGNLGDDLFIHELCNRYKSHSFYIVGSEKYKTYFSHCSNLHYVAYDDKKWGTYYKFKNRVNRIMKKPKESQITTIRLLLSKICKLTVLIGGSVFIQQENWKKELESRWKLLPNRSVLLGCNYRLANSNDYMKEYIKLLSTTKDVCFRDYASYKVFSRLSNTRVASDILFSLNRDECRDDGYYIISLINVEKKAKNINPNIYYQKMAECADLLQEKGHKVVLFSFCNAEGDLEAANKVLELLRNRSNVELFEHNSIEKSLKCLKACKGIITSRFHGMVLGIRFQKELYVLSYSDKTMQVIQDIKYTGEYKNITEIADVSASEICLALRKKYTVTDAINPEEQYKVLDSILIANVRRMS